MKPVYSEFELLNGMIKNHYPAFKQFFSETQHIFTYFTDKQLKNWPESKLVVDDIFIKIWQMPEHEKREKFETLNNLKNYIYTACSNAVKDQFRKKQRVISIADATLLLGETTQGHEADLLEARITEVELLQKLNKAIDELTPDRKKIFKFFLEGLDTAQIAKEMGISEEAVRNAKFKGLKQLKKQLRPGDLILLLAILSIRDNSNFSAKMYGPSDEQIKLYKPLADNTTRMGANQAKITKPHKL